MRIPVGLEQFDVAHIEQLILRDYCLHFIDRWRVNGEIEGVELFLLQQTLLGTLTNGL